ncbi:hypothetical protein ACI6Q2_01375 [Chitinophagaceae bacterium LWZ2-11]
MGVRKLYEEEILKLLPTVPEEVLPAVILLMQGEKEKKHTNSLKLIKEGRGKYKHVLSSVDAFMKRKQEEKLLDR